MPTPLHVLFLATRPEDVQVLEDELRRAGLEPVSRRAETTEEFLTALDAPPDVILAESSLPGLDPLTALGLLRQRGQSVPCLVIADRSAAEQAVAALHEGAADCLFKDRLDRLGPAVGQALERQRQQAAEGEAPAADATQRRRGEEERSRLLEERARLADHLRLLLESTGEGIYGLDREGRCTFINQAGARMLGFRPEELVGQEMHARIHHQHADGSPYPREQCPIRRALQHHQGCRVAHEVLWRQDGTAFAAEYASHPILQGGESLGAVVTFLDVTERKRLEEQYRQAQKMEAVGRLASGVAHDFNNLLTVITGYSEFGLGQVPPEHPLRGPLREIHRAGERAKNLTGQLLAFSRKQAVAPVTLDLNDLIRETEQMLRRLIGEDIHYTTDLAPGPSQVRADPGQLEQVIVNLVVNARDAMPGGGSLTLTTRRLDLPQDLALAPAAGPHGPCVLVAVRDTGCGMDEATRARIFEPFFTTKEPGKGTGLGLAMVYSIVQQSGGHLEVESAVGQGSTFRVYLPRIEETVSGGKSLPGLFKIPGGRETVLLVEDEDVVRALARLALRGSGYTVLEARDGPQALELCQRHPGPIHLLVTDVIMPHMSGRELADRLTALRPGLPVLFLSGYTEDVLGRAGPASAGAFLPKPFTPSVLARKVRELLDRKDSPTVRP